MSRHGKGADGSDAVSSVVSAVLLFALFTSVFVVYTVQTLPQWEADREQVHHAEVAQELSSLKADLEGLAGRADPGPASAVVQLGTPPVPILQPVAAGATLAVVGGSQGLTATATFPATAKPSVFLTGGAAVASPTALTTSPPCPSGRCIQSLEALVLGLATSGAGGAGNSASLTATATDGTGATVTARVAHDGSGSSCTGQLSLTLSGSSVPAATSQVLLCGVGAALASAGDPYRVNLLDPVYGFGAAVGRLQPPVALTFTTATTGTGTVQASTYAAVWIATDGAEGVAGTGVVNAAPVAPQVGSRLLYTPLYQRYPQEALSFEGGAVLANQGGPRQAVAADPGFTLKVNATTGVGTLRWTLVQLTGSGAVSGTKQATASLTYVSSQDLLLVTPATCNPCATFTLVTPAATGWNHYFADRALGAGAGASAVAGTSGNATLVLASGAGQSVTAGWHLHLKVIQARLDVH